MRLFCQDESRIGQHLPSGRRITLPGVKPHRVMCPLYEYYWLYAAVEPASGEAFWLEMPRLDSGCFQLFLDHFSRQHPDSLNLLVIDNAPAHVAKTLRVPDNIILIDLPPYCPELNPVERLWQDLKRRLVDLGTQVRLSMDTLRQAADQFIQNYTLEQLASLTGYPYLLNMTMK